MDNFFQIDGSVLEGGGQILRMAISLSALLGKPVRISKIRQGRAKPGLAAQHMKGIELVESMCNARLRGVHVGSAEVEFTPGVVRGGTYHADPKTAGSISLLLQVALPVALFADSPVVLELRGGTNADMAPQIDFMTEVFRPNLERFGGSFDLELHRRGYYPRGGGHVTASVRPVAALRALRLVDCGAARRVFGWSFVAGSLPVRMAHEMSEGARAVLSELDCDVDIDCYKEDQRIARDNCSGIVLVCETSSGCTLGGAALGARGAAPAAVGRGAAAALCADMAAGACVDTHTQDQLILYMVLARGRSAVRVGELTLHTRTAIHVAELLTQCKFDIEPCGSTNVISCTGIGYRAKTA